MAAASPHSGAWSKVSELQPPGQGSGEMELTALSRALPARPALCRKSPAAWPLAAAATAPSQHTLLWMDKM